MQDLLPWMAPWSLWSLYAFLFFAGCVHIWHGWHGHRFHSTPRCPRCGYDRTGLPSDTCPECGRTPRDPGEAFRSRRRRYWLIALGLIVCTALPAVAVQRRVRQYGWQYYRRVGPAYWLFPTDTEWSYDIAGYRIDSISDPRDWNGGRFIGEILRVRRRGVVYLREEDKDGTRIITNPAPGTDLNGNGIPDVIYGVWPGGHSAIDYTILELRPQEPVVIGTFSNYPDIDFKVIPAGGGKWEIDAPLWHYDNDRGWSSTDSTVAWNGTRFEHVSQFNFD